MEYAPRKGVLRIKLNVATSNYHKTPKKARHTP
nr:MAG TPA: hypothetical protein [Caudoviricetes sp.]DAW16309.1 MAG TPA: hypothetical protein [Caudoviricetes sp.]